MFATEESRNEFKASLERYGFDGPHHMGDGPFGPFAPEAAFCQRCGCLILLHQVMDNPIGGQPEKVDRGIFLHTKHHYVIDGMLDALTIMTEPKEKP